MTAVPSWHSVSDAELARAAAAGDRRAFAGIYDRYANRLHDFCVGMLADRDAAADCVQDAFCEAATSLTRLREPDKLRPFLYSIARHKALRRIGDRRREHVVDELPDVQSGDAGPDTLAARSELANLIAEAAGGLSDRDRTVLELAYRHGLDGPQLAEALGVSHSNAYTMVQRMRETIERSLGALLVARGAQRNPNHCRELGAILAGWDGRFSVLMRKRIARHIESCATCERERRRLVNPAALLGGVPVFIPAPDWLRGHVLSQVQLTSYDSSMNNTADGGGSPPGRSDFPSRGPVGASPSALAETGGGGDSGPATVGMEPIPAGHDQGSNDRRTRRFAVLVALLVGVPFVCLGLIIAWLRTSSAPVTPAGVSGTPRPSNGAPTSQLPATPAPQAPTRRVTPIVTPAPSGPTKPPGDSSGTGPQQPTALVPPVVTAVPPSPSGPPGPTPPTYIPPPTTQIYTPPPVTNPVVTTLPVTPETRAPVTSNPAPPPPPPPPPPPNGPTKCPDGTTVSPGFACSTTH